MDRSGKGVQMKRFLMMISGAAIAGAIVAWRRKSARRPLYMQEGVSGNSQTPVNRGGAIPDSEHRPLAGAPTS